ncbi:PDZ domain-containing protein [Stagnimonas aquatica]|uniref:PDZ domain-containing protein n=1 Tax=Stagnimonas aquatica TaxID=2689987 RepID=A0A3N0V878_9GAMM|nr:PDZ domain-containing protein [Stagnimonas aquatica]ROH88774.1 PDZ domain-containing protein [Stagnimonas aquatica]
MRIVRLLPPLLLALSLAVPAQAKKPEPEAGVSPEQRAQLQQAEQNLRAAREQLLKSARELARLQGQFGQDTPFSQAMGLLADPRRATLGVSIAPGPLEKGRQRGVLVTAVTPGSGAEKAGIQSGDLILSANGQSLELAEDARPGPGLTLRQTLRELEPGATVSLAVERGGKRKTVSVMAQRQDAPSAPDFDIERFGPRGDLLLPRMPGEPGALPPPPGPRFGRLMAGPLGGPGFQLARLDEDLAGYFKTREGVLVVKAPPVIEGAPALKSGDVIQSINGQPVRSPVDLLDQFFNLEPKAQLSLVVVRQGATLSLQGQLPEPPMPGPRPHEGKRPHEE